MKFAICNETFQDWSFERACAFARECGYTGLEIAPFTLGASASEITAKQREEVCKQATEADLEIIGLHWLLAKTEGFYVTSPDPTVRKKTGEYITELAKLCRDLGGSLMVFGSPQQRNILPGVAHEQAMDFATEIFESALPTLESCGVTVAIEPLGSAEGNFLLTAAEGVQLIERIGSPFCRLHLDVKAMSCEVTPIPEIIRQNKSLLHHFHANDPNRQGPGFGEVDFLPIFAALGEIDYRGWVSVEVFDYSPGIERLAKESIDYMQDCLLELADKEG